LVRILRAAGHEPAAAARADLVIVNTCGFIDAAKEESLAAVFAAAATAHERGAQVAAIGCLVERYRTELTAELPEADLLCGFETDPLVRRLNEFAARRSRAIRAVDGEEGGRGGRLRQPRPTYAYVKISDGCDRHCSYCAIPLIKGTYEELPPETILAAASAALATGARELVLVGQDTSRYAWPGYGGVGRLLGDLHSLGPAWLRLLYLQPDGVSDELLQALAEYAVPYIDIPLQHASATVLKRMNRRGDGNQYLDLLERLRMALPGVVIRSTFIAGFPGETEADVDELIAFVNAAGLAVAGVFVYDEQEGTSAAAMPGQVPLAVREERAARVAAAVDEAARPFWSNLVGQRVEVLVEGTHRGDDPEVTGRLAIQAPDIDGFTVVRGSRARRRQLVRARIEAVVGYTVFAVAE
jgi:ribosomal protein S12 methylthiotransferase